MNQVFDTVIILNPELSLSDRASVIEQCMKKMRYYTHRDIKLEEWGVKRLAYPIRKHETGDYIAFTHNSTIKGIEQLGKMLEANPGIILKSISVRKDSICDEEEIEQDGSDDLLILKEEVVQESYQINALDVLLGLADYPS